MTCIKTYRPLDGILCIETDNEFILRSLLGFCGCVSNNIMDDLFEILNIFEHDPKLAYYTKIAQKMEESEKYIELLLCCLDKTNLIEHGSAIRGSWLNSDMKPIWELIQKNHRGELSEPEALKVLNEEKWKYLKEKLY